MPGFSAYAAQSLLLALLLSGCRFALVDTLPLNGPAPASIAVWPTVPLEHAADEDALLTGLDLAVRSRGYRTVSVAVGRQLLEQAGMWQPHAAVPRDAAAAGVALGVDAVLELDVRRFETSVGELRHASWDLVWRLRSTRGAGVLWEYAHNGAWNRSDEHRADPLRRLDAQLEVKPLGEPRGWSFRSRADLAANLHRLALAKLPAAGS